jgi:exopolysaccharide production protein ExoQ
MAHDGFPAGVVPWRAHAQPWIAEAAYLALLLLVFVGLSPFAVRELNALALGQDINAGKGDIARQICYFLVFAVIAASALHRRGLQAIRAVPVLLAVLLAWCALSALWSIEPAVTLRRAVLAIIVVLSVMLGVGSLGVDRSLRLWRLVLAGVLIVNWLSIPFIDQAVHLPGEADPQLVGDWRGLYIHKNIAGAISAISALVFLYFAVEKRRLIDIALCLAAIAFAVMTHSKTALGLLPISIVAFAAYRFASRRSLDRQIVMVGLALVFVIGTTALLLESDNIVRLLSNPQELTGRTAIWQAEIGYIRDHPLLGAGFGSFADTGVHSPIYSYAGSEWVGNVAHGHNGYLQLLVTVGIAGFVLAMATLVIGPLLMFLRGGEGVELRSLLFAIFCFIVLHNLVESDFLEGDGAVWVSFLLGLSMLRESRATLAPRVLT